MAATFDNWLEASFDGIGPLYFTRLAKSGEIQAVSKYVYPRRDGQDGEDQGRLPLIIGGEMLFSANFGDKEGYPKRFIEIRAKKAEAGAKYFVDPDYGAILGRFSQFDVSYDPMRINECKVAFTFEEYSDEALPGDKEQVDQSAKALEAAGTADAGLTTLGISTGATTFTADVESFSTILADPTYTVQQIEGAANAMRSKVETVLADSQLQDPRNYEVRSACRTIAAKVQELAAQAKSDAPQDLPLTVDVDTWPIMLAIELYKDRDRAAELVAKNPSRFFFWPKGTELRVPDR